MKTAKNNLIGTACAVAFSLSAISPAHSQDMSRGADNFYQSDKVEAQTVRFKNQYGMEVVGTLFAPKTLDKETRHAAIIVSHPFRAVRQQAANLYATKMAEQGFVTLSFDQSFWGESEGSPRGAVSPDIYTENISAAVDYLGMRPYVDRERIGAIGICAGGGFTIAAAKMDLRIKAVATSGMYDMGEFFRTGIGHSQSAADLQKILAFAIASRYEEFQTGKATYADGHSGALSSEALESEDFYETSRGKVPSNDRRTPMSSYVKFMNFYPFADIETISPRPILFIVGAKAPSAQFTYDAYNKAAQPKELCEIKDASRLDLYDRTEVIPWDRLTRFFEDNLKPLSHE